MKLTSAVKDCLGTVAAIESRFLRKGLTLVGGRLTSMLLLPNFWLELFFKDSTTNPGLRI